MKKITLTKLVLAGVMAAMVFAVTFFRFPLLGSKVHFANAFCLLAGMLLGPVIGGFSAGLGSAIYDLTAGYDLVNILITFVSKFAMAAVAGGILMIPLSKKLTVVKAILAAVTGSLAYVFLYMLKTYVYQRFVYAFPLDATWVTMTGKLIPSLINAGLSIVSVPILYMALKPALRAAGVLSDDAPKPQPPEGNAQ